MRYAIVIERSENSFGAWVPDLPGCVALGDSAAEVQRRMRDAIGMHLAGMREDGDPIPPATTGVEYVDVVASQ